MSRMQQISLHESGLHLHSHRVKGWLCTKLDIEESFLQEDRMRSLREVEQSKKMCCSETERANCLRMDELSIQEPLRTPPRSRHTVMCVTVQSHREKVLWTHHHRSTMAMDGTKVDDVSWRSQGAQGCSPSWKYTGTQQGDTCCESLRVQPFPKTRSFHFIHPKQCGAFPKRIVLPSPYSDIFLWLRGRCLVHTRCFHGLGKV